MGALEVAFVITWITLSAYIVYLLRSRKELLRKCRLMAK
ncbi:CcmD family protein [uncultured Methanolobus sp.]